MHWDHDPLLGSNTAHKKMMLICIPIIFPQSEYGIVSSAVKSLA